MIQLIDVSFQYPDTPPLLQGVSVQFQPQQRIGIIALPGAGKSTLAKLLCGAINPSQGALLRDGSISWPLGFAGLFHPELNAVDNLQLLANSSGESFTAMLDWAILFGGLGDTLDKPLKLFTPQQRAMLGYCCSLAIPTDWLLADETLAVGGRPMLAQCEQALQQRLRHSGLIFISKNTQQLKKHCQRFFALIDGQLIECPDVDIAEQVLAQWHPHRSLSNGRRVQ
ncbi:ATP-binding cassette domain-containing protein [Ferrimonas senticii]|uniref:ATP-binding cassette domain-containing protein n=1 Tax=Ferrimonas senticii TaxID=394566 RepID=UPI0003FD1F4E|nr:ATP-binding cassette domain-containing protein [Ferrimonas senticii]